jgi:hypothetical protein
MIADRVAPELPALAGALNAVFRPNIHSMLRRSDLNRSRELFDRYRGALAEAKEQAESQLTVYRQYSDLFSKMYEERGARLVESTLEKDQSSKVHGKSK